jgi:hypothetical protein
MAKFNKHNNKNKKYKKCKEEMLNLGNNLKINEGNRKFMGEYDDIFIIYKS